MDPIALWGSEPEEFDAYKKTYETLPAFSKDAGLPPTNRHHRNRKDGFVLDSRFLRGEYEVRDFLVNPGDVFVVSFPKSGTTWLQEIVYAVTSYLDFDTAKSQVLDKRYLFLENEPLSRWNPAASTRPRLIMSHLSYSHLPKSIIESKAKILYICRNPKDVLISFYHFYHIKKALNFGGDLTEFFELFLDDKVVYSPFAKHVLQFWERRHEPNVCFLKYEDLHKDTVNGVKRIANFLEKPLTDDQIRRVIEHCSFENMSNTPTMNYQKLFDSGIYDSSKGKFIRKGRIGEWKDCLTEEMNRRMDDWIELHFKNTGFNFDYE